MIAWLVTFANKHVICTGFDREDAKRTARAWIGGNPDDYIIEPLSAKGDQVMFYLVTQI